MSIEAMKLALEFVEANTYGGDDTHKLITTLRTAIEQAKKQEPVGEVEQIEIDDDGQASAWFTIATEMLNLGDKLYTSPPPRQPLTDEEFISMVDSDGIQVDPELAFTIKEMVEKAHGIYPENSDCHGRDWTERDEEYLK